MRAANLFLTVFLPVLLLACGGGGGGDSSNSNGSTSSSNGSSSGGTDQPPELPISIVSGKTTLIDATVTVRSWVGGEKRGVLAKTFTDSNGNYSVSLQTPDKPILLELEGGYYTEESSEKRIALGLNQKLRAMALFKSSLDVSVMVTPWTNVAVALAEYKIDTGTAVEFAISESNEQVSRVVGVDVIATAPANIRSVGVSSLSDEIIYGFHLAAASSLTASLSEEKNTTHTSIEFADIMYHDVLFDGVLNGRGYRATTTQDIDLFLGDDVAVNVALYRRLLALHMLEVAQASFNSTELTIGDILPHARRYANSTDTLFPDDDPIPLDDAGPDILLTEDKNKVYSGEIDLPISVTDISNISRIEFILDGKPLNEAVIDTSEYIDGTYVLTVNAWDNLDNASSVSFNLDFNNTLSIDSARIITNSSPFPLTGKVKVAGRSGLVVTANDLVADVSNDGIWSVDLPLSDTATIVTVTANDDNGNESIVETTIYLDQEAPKITPDYSSATFYNSSTGQKISGLLDTSDLPILVTDENAFLNGLAADKNTLVENNIPYIEFDVLDPEIGLTSGITVEKQFSINNISERGFSSLKAVDGKYLIALVGNHLSDNWIVSRPDDSLKITLAASDDAGNRSTFDYEFSVYSTYPLVQINSELRNATVTASRYSNGSIGDVVGQCETDEVGYCPMLIEPGVGDLFLRFSDGRYYEPSLDEEVSFDVLETYIHIADTEVDVHITPFSRIFGALVDASRNLSASEKTFISLYGFHPYLTEPLLVDGAIELSDGVKLSLLLDGVSHFALEAAGHEVNTIELMNVMAGDYAADGLFDGQGGQQLTLVYGDLALSANTYRNQFALGALNAAGNTSLPSDVVYNYLNALSRDSNSIYGDAPTVDLDNVAPSLSVTSALIVNNVSYVAKGTYSDDSPVTVTVNGAIAELSGNEWSLNVGLKPSEYNELVIVARDVAGNSASETVLVGVDVDPPRVNFTQSSGQVIDRQSDEPRSVNAIPSNTEAALYITTDKLTTGTTPWSFIELSKAGFMYINPQPGENVREGVFTPKEEIIMETRYKENGNVMRDWAVWDKPGTELTFTEETLMPNWYASGPEVIREIEIRLTDKAGNVSEVANWQFRAVIAAVEPEVLGNIRVDQLFFKAFVQRNDLNNVNVESGEYSFTSPSTDMELVASTSAVSFLRQEIETGIRVNQVQEVTREEWQLSQRAVGVYEENADDDEASSVTCRSSAPTRPEPVTSVINWDGFRDVEVSVPAPIFGSVSTVSSDNPSNVVYAWEEFHIDNAFRLFRSSGGVSITYDYTKPDVPVSYPPEEGEENLIGRVQSGSFTCGRSSGNGLERRTIVTLESQPGYPDNVYSFRSVNASSNSSSFQVFIGDEEILSDNGVFLIPANSEVKIIKLARLPVFTPANDNVVENKQATLPYAQQEYDFSLNYTVGNDISISLNVPGYAAKSFDIPLRESNYSLDRSACGAGTTCPP